VELLVVVAYFGTLNYIFNYMDENNISFKYKVIFPDSISLDDANNAADQINRIVRITEYQPALFDQYTIDPWYSEYFKLTLEFIPILYYPPDVFPRYAVAAKILFNGIQNSMSYKGVDIFQAIKVFGSNTIMGQFSTCQNITQKQIFVVQFSDENLFVGINQLQWVPPTQVQKPLNTVIFIISIIMTVAAVSFIIGSYTAQGFFKKDFIPLYTILLLGSIMIFSVGIFSSLMYSSSYIICNLTVFLLQFGGLLVVSTSLLRVFYHYSLLNQIVICGYKINSLNIVLILIPICIFDIIGLVIYVVISDIDPTSCQNSVTAETYLVTFTAIYIFLLGLVSLLFFILYKRKRLIDSELNDLGGILKSILVGGVTTFVSAILHYFYNFINQVIPYDNRLYMFIIIVGCAFVILIITFYSHYKYYAKKNMKPRSVIKKINTNST